MLLAQSTIRTILEIVGEDRFPRSAALRAGMQLAMVFDRDTWVRRVDTCLVGGDPLVLAMRLRRLVQQSPGARIGIVLEPATSTAPIAVLDDPDQVADFVRKNALPARYLEARSAADLSASAIVENALTDLGPHLDLHGGPGVLMLGHAQAARDDARGEIVLRLASPRPAIVPSQGAGGDVLVRSRAIAERALRCLQDEPLRSYARPPAGDRFADVLVARRVEVLDGYLSPGFGGTGRMGPDFMRDEIGADLFALAEQNPVSVDQAISLWQRDLLRAGGRHPSLTSQGD